jgi:uncharacterized glyoxalase superfamily protein PhnB
MKNQNKYQAVVPYLFVNGALALIDFVQKVFDAKLLFHVMHNETMIKHAEVKIGGSTIMLADCTEELKPCGATLIICVNNVDAAYTKAIELGAKVVSEITDQAYSRTGSVTDSFGITWWITSVI